jgi:hypothetical protein
MFVIIMVVFDAKIMEPLFWILEETRGVIQMESYHPEGDVFTHSLQVLQVAFRETIDTDLILAAMLHDVGKIGNSMGHEKIGTELLDCHCSAKTLWLIEHHMRIWHLILGQMRKKSKIEYLNGHPWLPELILLASWDKMGRNPNREVAYNQEKIIARLNWCVEKRFAENQQKEKGE